MSITTLARTTAIAIAMTTAFALSGCSAINGIIDSVNTGPTSDQQSQNDNTPRPANPDEEIKSAFEIRVGDCFNDPLVDDGQLVQDIALIDCSKPHDEEAYFAEDMKYPSYPGEQTIKDFAQSNCLPKFFEFIGADATYTGNLDYGYFFPSSGSWDEGDREILCYVYDLDQQVTGTLEGAAKSS